MFESGPTTLTRHDVLIDALRWQGSLAGLDLRPNDRILVLMSGLSAWPGLQFAAGLQGLIVVPVNVKLEPSEIGFVIEKTRPAAIVVERMFRGRDLLGHLEQAIKEAQLQEPCVVVACSEAEIAECRVDSSVRSPSPPARRGVTQLDWREFMGTSVDDLGQALAKLSRQPGMDRDYLIQFTSGTTAFPKGAVLTEMQLLRFAYEFGTRLGLRSGDVVLSTQPFHHIGGTMNTTFMPFVHDVKMVVPYFYSPRNCLRLIEQERCTVRYGTDAMYQMELGLDEFESFDLSSLERGWTLGSPEFLSRVTEKMGMAGLVSAYGLTEACGGPAIGDVNDPAERRLESGGRPVPGTHIEARVIGTKEPLPRGEVGELSVRGWCTMSRYWGEADATRKVFDSDGWLRTGDLGFVDGAGYVHFVDRLKDIVRPGGENVSASEVEAMLLAHPAIEQASVIRIPDPVLGEVPGAAVRVKSGSDVTGETLQHWCEGKLASFKIPRRIWMVAEFPMTESGKVVKRLLEEQLLGPGSQPQGPA
jgi:acyl-CoA synthetase (AMP-forming)/AMP-acid ligase II